MRLRIGSSACFLTLLLCVNASAQAGGSSAYPKLEVLARALAHIEASYVGEVTDDALIEGAIRGMLKVLDPHSAYLDAKELRILDSDTEGQFGGVGIEVDVNDGWLTVLRVMPGGPAAKAGVRAGDRFLRIDGLSARDLSIEDALQRMRGEPGTRVQVSLRRHDAPNAIDLTLTREIIHVDAVEGRLLPDGVVYVQLRVFQQDTITQLRRVLDEAVDRAAAQSGKVSGVLLDLRDNPGGLLSAAVLVADEFLNDGVIVSTRGRGGKLLRENRAQRSGTRPDWPMVVLTNGFSASAAEIVAGALHDHKRAVLVGTRSFGKGSVQNIVDLPDGTAMKLTTALYFTPAGTSIQARGIEPDVQIEQLDPAVLREARLGGGEISEAALTGHLGNANANTPPQPPAASTSADRQTPKQPASADKRQPDFQDDYQAFMGHQVLKALVAQRGAAH
ncbi:MAG TPA: S41 family peptidase [Polyangiales bacterium]|nr:S41 family peptidase [Polyangiales bacterium]